eukprot:3250264-Prymnesium_polylepis.1
MRVRTRRERRRSWAGRCRPQAGVRLVRSAAQHRKKEGTAAWRAYACGPLPACGVLCVCVERMRPLSSRYCAPSVRHGALRPACSGRWARDKLTCGAVSVCSELAAAIAAASREFSSKRHVRLNMRRSHHASTSRDAHIIMFLIWQHKRFFGQYENERFLVSVRRP